MNALYVLTFFWGCGFFATMIAFISFYFDKDYLFESIWHTTMALVLGTVIWPTILEEIITAKKELELEMIDFKKELDSITSIT